MTFDQAERDHWRGYNRCRIPFKAEIDNAPQLPDSIVQLTAESEYEPGFWFRHLFDAEGNVL